MFFCALVITQQESFWLKTSSSPDQVVFVLPGTPDDWWIDSTEAGTHGAAGDWDYLFQDWITDSQANTPLQATTPSENISSQANMPLQSNNSSYTSTSSQGLSPQTPSSSVEKDYFPPDNQDSSLTGSLNGELDNNLILPSWITIDTWVQSSWLSLSQQDFVCITSWGEYVANGDFVLAYEQRKDVTNLCNVQRRYCINGKLSGFYSQKSCKEHTLYSYVKPEAISYTQKPKDTFIQPTEPSLNWSNFDTHGKINWTSDSIDTWWSPSSGRPADTNSVSQTSTANIKCVTPWWEQVKNGQFIKAYKSSIGLIDLPCEVELRLCVGWKLKWYYANRTCTFKKMTYRDYLVQNYDENKPTIGDLINTIDTEESETTYTNRSFWQWLDKYF